MTHIQLLKFWCALMINNIYLSNITYLCLPRSNFYILGELWGQFIANLSVTINIYILKAMIFNSNYE